MENEQLEYIRDLQYCAELYLEWKEMSIFMKWPHMMLFEIMAELGIAVF